MPLDDRAEFAGIGRAEGGKEDGLRAAGLVQFPFGIRFPVGPLRQIDDDDTFKGFEHRGSFLLAGVASLSVPLLVYTIAQFRRQRNNGGRWRQSRTVSHRSERNGGRRVKQSRPDRCNLAHHHTELMQ